MHKLAAARNQRHAACRQFVLGEKRLQRVGQVSLVGDNAVDQAALGQLHLRGGGNARAPAVGLPTAAYTVRLQRYKEVSVAM